MLALTLFCGCKNVRVCVCGTFVGVGRSECVAINKIFDCLVCLYFGFFIFSRFQIFLRIPQTIKQTKMLVFRIYNIYISKDKPNYKHEYMWKRGIKKHIEPIWLLLRYIGFAIWKMKQLRAFKKTVHSIHVNWKCT